MDCQPQIHLAAIHAQAGYRGDTAGLGALCRERDGAALLGAGFYQNSIGKHSNYVFAGLQPWAIGPVRVGAFAGVVNGYALKNGGYFVAGGAMASVPLAAVGLPSATLHVIALPPTAQSPVTAGFSVSFKF
jgi:hypothetical protein